MAHVSIVVPIYNVEQYIDKVIQSILQQTYTDFELLLIDDGSTDASGELAKKYATYDSRVHYHYKANGGLADARNYGMQFVTSKWINFIDGDDEVTPDYLAHLIAAKEATNADIVVARFFNLAENKHIDEVTWPENESNLVIESADDSLKTILAQKRFEVSAWAKLYNFNLFEHIQYPFGKLYEDFLTTTKLIDHADKVAFIDNQDYAYRVRENSISAGQFMPKKMDGAELSEEMIAYVKKYRPDALSYAYARAFSTVSSLYLQMPVPNQTYQQEEKKLWQLMQKYRSHFIFNRHIRMKTLLAGWLSYLGARPFKQIGQMKKSRN
ncbi:glycosyltransferase involved in cell wall biosynthesis [Weissella uvarum]|uniref:glycosyltransferase family 2 protein n=1 Tax=Weissella uvarum TaxID=1479233 RepID=UPI00195F5706|nr:glycosyltransferase family 2 protein [Weissella uvarum]MBM7617961.1 glycosyltransferase involved in cell wall biosynthesis [Weissella uvarum]MCM0596180.1 glycosyltransferase family 2 protein [Weissella uvarum]